MNCNKTSNMKTDLRGRINPLILIGLILIILMAKVVEVRHYNKQFDTVTEWNISNDIISNKNSMKISGIR